MYNTGRRLIFAAALAAVLCLASGRAHALKHLGWGAGRGLFLIPAFGFMVPLGDDHFTDLVDVSFKLDFPGKFGYLFRAGPVLIGPEFAVNFTPLTPDHDTSDLMLFRFRFLVCLRIVIPIPRFPRFRLIARTGIGPDLAFGSWGNEDDQSTGAGFEFTFGFEFLVHRRVGLGATMDLPFSVHPEEFFGDDYFSAELDYMFHVSIYMWP
jgi:hypothetical protein